MTTYLTIGQAAERLGLQSDTLRKLESNGEITAVRTNGGHRRFTEAEVDRFQKSRRGRRKTSQKRNPSTGEFAGHDAAFANDREEFDEELPIEDWEAEELATYRPPPPPRPAPAPQPPQPSTAQPLPSLFDPTDTERRRLENIRMMGLGAIPWGTPAEWYRQVIVDLERYVTTSQFPTALPAFKAMELVTDRVKTILRPWREAEEKAKRAKEAAEASERKRNALIARGNEYARRETTDWDYSARIDAWTEVKKVLLRDVKPDMTDLEVEDIVDEVLDRWDDEDDDDQDEADGED